MSRVTKAGSVLKVAQQEANMPTNKTPVKPEDVYLTVLEIAARDRCSTRTVRRAIKAGLLEAVRIGLGGRSIRISQAAHAVYRQRLAGGS